MKNTIVKKNPLQAGRNCTHGARHYAEKKSGKEKKKVVKTKNRGNKKKGKHQKEKAGAGLCLRAYLNTGGRTKVSKKRTIKS